MYIKGNEKKTCWAIQKNNKPVPNDNYKMSERNEPILKAVYTMSKKTHQYNVLIERCNMEHKPIEK